MVMVGAIVAVAVCCMMGLALVYNRRQKRKRGHAPSSVYSQVGQDSPNMFGHRQQSMLLMNPMFSSSGKERKSTIAMKSAGNRMSFLANPLFDTSEDNVDIPESPSSDSEAELLGGQEADRRQSGFQTPLYATGSGMAQGDAPEIDFESTMALLGAEFESTFSALEECIVESSPQKEMLEVALTTWQEINADMVSTEGIDIATAQEVNAEKLAQLKQSLNKIEQGALLSGRMSMDAKNEFMAVLNQARSKLRHVEKFSRQRSNTSAKAEDKPAEPEWLAVRKKLKAIGKFKANMKSRGCL